MRNAEVSVLMPVYNAEKYIAKAIESILEQTFSDFEFIITNDGSTDNSLDVIKKYAAADDRIKVIDRENRGIIFTRNEGLDISSGRYIALMDADDISLPYRLEKQLEFLTSHNDHAAVGGQAILIDSDGDTLAPFNVMESHDEIDGAHINGRGGAIVNPSSMIRKESILKIGGYHAQFDYAEDFEFWLRLGEVGKLANLPEILIYYRQHLESVGYAKRRTQIESTITAVAEACTRRAIEIPKQIHLMKNSITLPTKTDIYMKWAWWAQGTKNNKAAKKYVLKTLKINPFNVEAWKLIFCLIRGR